jgi:hypothetical protein
VALAKAVTAFDDALQLRERTNGEAKGDASSSQKKSDDALMAAWDSKLLLGSSSRKNVSSCSQSTPAQFAQPEEEEQDNT